MSFPRYAFIHKMALIFKSLVVHRVVFLYPVEQKDGKSERLEVGVDLHKVDGEVCGWDEWMV